MPTSADADMEDLARKRVIITSAHVYLAKSEIFPFARSFRQNCVCGAIGRQQLT